MRNDKRKNGEDGGEVGAKDGWEERTDGEQTDPVLFGPQVLSEHQNKNLDLEKPNMKLKVTLCRTLILLLIEDRGRSNGAGQVSGSY